MHVICLEVGPWQWTRSVAKLMLAKRVLHAVQCVRYAAKLLHNMQISMMRSESLNQRFSLRAAKAIGEFGYTSLFSVL